MKKIVLILLAALLALSVCACTAKEEDPSNIDDYAAPDFTHKITTGTLEFEEGHAESAVITGYTGLSTPHTVKIPNEVGEREVSGIGENAFYHLSTVKAIELPETVTFIGKNAFAGCTALETIVIPASVTYIDAYAFAKCTSLKSVVFKGKAVTEIRDFAFIGCSALETIVLPEGLESIGKEAFSGCSAIKAIKTPTTLKSIDNLAFYQCPGLNADGALELTASITEIGEFAFSGINKKYIKAPEGSYAADYVSKMADEAETEEK